MQSSVDNAVTAMSQQGAPVAWDFVGWKPLYTTPQPKQEQGEPVMRVTIKDFVKAVEGKEDLVGRPIYWAQWPNEEKNT
jgi:hypothetical protein